MILNFQCIKLTLPPKGLKAKKYCNSCTLQSFLNSITSEVKTYYGLLGVLPIPNVIVRAKVPTVKWPFEEKKFEIQICEKQALNNSILGALFKKTCSKIPQYSRGRNRLLLSKMRTLLVAFSSFALWSQSFSFGHSGTVNKQPLLLGHQDVMAVRKHSKLNLNTTEKWKKYKLGQNLLSSLLKKKKILLSQKIKGVLIKKNSELV